MADAVGQGYPGDNPTFDYVLKESVQNIVTVALQAGTQGNVDRVLDDVMAQLNAARDTYGSGAKAIS